MSKVQKDPLRGLSTKEQHILEKMVKSTSERVDVVKRAKALLSVRSGKSYTEAAEEAGYQSNDAVSQLVSRFNQRGLSALGIARGRGRKPTYSSQQQAQIVRELQRPPRPQGRSDGHLVPLHLATSLTQEGACPHCQRDDSRSLA